MPKTSLFILTLVVILLTAIATIVYNVLFLKTAPKSEIESAIHQAYLIYRERKANNEDFSNGPCLSNALRPDWVLDIAHNPRQPIDDIPQNQCPAYVQRTAHHFVELDPEGDLIRAR